MGALDDLGRVGEDVDSALVDVESLEVEHATRIGWGRTLWCEETARVIPTSRPADQPITFADSPTITITFRADGYDHRAVNPGNSYACNGLRRVLPTKRFAE